MALHRELPANNCRERGTDIMPSFCPELDGSATNSWVVPMNRIRNQVVRLMLLFLPALRIRVRPAELQRAT
jgi:hypothetical protein